MLDEKWVRLAAKDEVLELRELCAFASDPEASKFLRLKAGEISDDGSAVVGRAGYLFVNDGSNRWRDQLGGAAIIGEEALTDTTKYLQEAQRRFAEANVMFRFLVVPEKDIIYPELSPNVGWNFCEHRSVHRVTQAIPDNVIYPVAELRAASERMPVFHPRNSHVNFYGGLTIAQELYKSLGCSELRANIPSQLASWPDDLSIKWTEQIRTLRRILGRFYEEEEVVKSESHVGRYLIFRNGSADSEKKVLVFGDSYSWNPDAGLARFLALGHREVHFIWTKLIDWDVVARISPNVVIIQSAERFLIKGLSQ